MLSLIHDAAEFSLGQHILAPPTRGLTTLIPTPILGGWFPDMFFRFWLFFFSAGM